MQPPRWADRLLEWFCAPHLLEEVQGDLHEQFHRQAKLFGEKLARQQYVWSVLSFVRPFALKRKPSLYSSTSIFKQAMIKNYFKIAFRNLLKHKGYSFINIAGLAVGMAVAMLIGLWVWDELSFNKSFKNYDYIGKIYQNRTFDGKVGTYSIVPIPISKELRTNFPEFKDVVLTRDDAHIIAFNDTKITQRGLWAEPSFTAIFSLEILKGVQNGLQDMHSIMLSDKMAQALFKEADPIGKVVRLDNKINLTVTGVFQHFPKNTEFSTIEMIAPWEAYLSVDEMARASVNNWGNNSWNAYLQWHPSADPEKTQAKLKRLMFTKVDKGELQSNPELFVHPMSKWHLYDSFTNGVSDGGRIQIVWLFGLIGLFVLLLACINFMNLSTARSEKRAKEVGIRKAIGSVRAQLVGQFLSESLLVVFMASLLTNLLVALALPWFNTVADKQMQMPWSNLAFWGISFGFILVTGLLSGSYPALYLSSFNPVKTLKGTFKVGRLAALPRKVLVVTQFTISVTLIIGTIIIYQQIQYVKNRPIGYDNNRLIFLEKNTPELQSLNHNVLRNELLATGMVENTCESQNPITANGNLNTGYAWEGLDPKSNILFGVTSVTHDWGKTVGIQLVEGRDFSRELSTDSTAILINEATAALMGKKTVIGSIITNYEQKKYHVIGVVKNIVGDSPYQRVLPSLYVLRYNFQNIITIKLKPTVSASAALASIETVFRKLNPASPFDYKFADQELAKKFESEEQIGKLATFFAVLAIFISCLGLFGLASFVAEQRTKEVGVRKVLGASVVNLWGLLSRDFVVLVIISCLISSPIAYYFMNEWLQKYTYHTEISWWIFAVSSIGALAITLLTVSYQAIKAAVVNPVKSLKSE
ncbi:MAG: permease prefix domain 2-containing transporter [Spirosomataceae bacterium]